MGVGTLIGLLGGIAAVVYWRRLHRLREADSPVALDDDAVRQIEQDGWVELDEPNDLDHIREEEARFWEESWDEPEEL